MNYWLLILLLFLAIIAVTVVLGSDDDRGEPVVVPRIPEETEIDGDR